ncbi:MAG: hypothetical protein ACTSQP_04515 [Promethearchaeota archaeon]
MIIELPEAYQGIGYLQGTSLILWLISIGIFFTSFVLFILKALKLEMKSQKKIFQGYGIFSLFFGITRIIFIIGVYIPEQYDFYTTLGYITGILGILYWLYVIETYLITNTKKIFMIITSVAFGIALIALIGQASRYFALMLIYILLPFAIVAIFMLYIYLIIKTTGIVRKRTIWLVIGLVILVIGYIMDTELFVGNFRWIPLEISPALMILGTLIFIITQLKE